MLSRTGVYLCFALFFAATTNTLALCGEPQPRLVCAEATNSRAVVVARLMRRKFRSSDRDSDLNIYSLESIRLIRGEIAHDFVIHERNDSGRSGVKWKIGSQYLLFVTYDKLEQAYIVEACGNSGFLSKSSKVIHQVRAMASYQEDPIISGLVTTDSWSTGVHGVDISATNATGVFKVRSDSEGRFELQVKPGTYSVTARTPNWSFEKGLLTYENPDHLILRSGACAQVHFEGKLVRP